ncbi:MAG: SMC family ATPase [Anaerolineae bacterium]|jgi:exonuclease SbcC
MIPQELSLSNFMCYRQATLDFSGIHVACLSGENGAGKSALLDAVTWALWGRARARRSDELIRLGQDEMEVDLSFQLGSDLYRVVRKRKAGKRSRSLLDFQIRDDHRWRSIAENTIPATERKIERVLRLDYDTFVNSAFLRQGRADEFTVKTPAERKRVLGEILRLDLWEVYEERAKERLRRVEEEAHVLDLRLEEIEKELARRPDYEEQVQAAQSEVGELSAALRETQQAWQELEAARAELRHVRTQIVELDERIEQAQREQQSVQEEQKEREARLSQYREVLGQGEEIQAGFAAYQEALERERDLGEKLSALTELNERRSALEAEIKEVEHDLRTQRELAAQRVQELEGRLPTPDLLQQHEEVQAKLAHLNQLREGREAARDDLARLAEERATLVAQNESLRVEMDSLKERIEALEQAEATCPLCDQSLSEGDRLRLVEDLKAKGKQKGDLYRANRARREEIAKERDGLQTQIAESEPLLEELPGLEQKAARLAERVRTGEEATQALEEVQVELNRLEAELEAEAYAPEPREALAEVLAQASELGYDAEAHKAARQAVSEGRPFAERKARLDAAREGVEQEQAALNRLEDAARRWKEQEEAQQVQKVELEKRIAQLEEELKEASTVEEELTRVRAAEAEARQRLGAAKQRLTACDALAEQLEGRRERRDELGRLQELYEELRTAFGIRGVPAMIIEAAMPEIEAEANRLLGRMTGGRMHVRLESQRETLAGEVRETLDIHIMDELGERPYENYSGGEQFRVNFALRIALSRLLARRAGAQLQTLIIDEGFGTQDAQGRERLVEAIHAIQDEFARVLVITHIEELQDAFPTRIQVTKTPQGSVAELM